MTHVEDASVAERGSTSDSGWANLLGYVMIVVQWILMTVRRTSLKLMDISLWLILSLTENSRAVRPTIRATFSKDERAGIREVKDTSACIAVSG